MKKTSIKTLRTKADNLLTPIVKKVYPQCLLCGAETQVGHHFVKKSESNALRYVLENIIPLCNHCHLALHSHESLYSARIVAIKGLNWFKDIERVKRQTVKTDKSFYQTHYEALSKLLSLL